MSKTGQQARVRHLEARTIASGAAPALTACSHAVVSAFAQQAGGQKAAPLTNVTRDITNANISSLQLSASQSHINKWFGEDSFQPAFDNAWSSK